MSKNKVGRPSKLDVDTMKQTDISVAIIIIILLLLLSFTVIMVINPDAARSIKASVASLFN